MVKLGEKLEILDRAIQFKPDKYFVPLEEMNETEKQAPEMVITDSQQGEIGSKDDDVLLWLTLADELRTASVDYDGYKMLNITGILQAAGF